MEKETILTIAKRLHDARINGKPIAQFKADYPGIQIRDAYSIQEEGIRMREASGEKVIAIKMGLTSEAKRKQMDLDSPLYGVLSDQMLIRSGGQFSLDGMIHPKIEPEVAFSIVKDLKGAVSREEVLDACDGVYPALEILDSRYEQFKYFSMEEVVSDNSSSCSYILGAKVEDFREIDLTKLEMVMKVNGEVSQSGTSEAISGDPVVSVIQLCELLAKRDLYLKAGTVVLAGAATAATPLESGMEVELSVEKLGGASVRIVS